MKIRQKSNYMKTIKWSNDTIHQTSYVEKGNNHKSFKNMISDRSTCRRSKVLSWKRLLFSTCSVTRKRVQKARQNYFTIFLSLKKFLPDSYFKPWSDTTVFNSLWKITRGPSNMLQNFYNWVAIHFPLTWECCDPEVVST